MDDFLEEMDNYFAYRFVTEQSGTADPSDDSSECDYPRNYSGSDGSHGCLWGFLIALFWILVFMVLLS